MVFGGVAMFVFWGTIIGLIIWGITRWTRNSRWQDTKSPIDIARERYAKGEITRDQFEQIKKDLS